MLHDRKNTWSSVERFALYVDKGGSCMCRKTLFRKLSEYHGENVLNLSSPGFVNVMGFRSELAQSLHLVKNTDHLMISVGDGGHLGFTQMPPNEMLHTLRIL